MTKLTPELLQKTNTEAWRDYYLHAGAELLNLALKLLNSVKENEIHLGLKIVDCAYFEEHEENPECATGLEHLNFSILISPLIKHLKKNESEAALRGLRNCFLNGAQAEGLEPQLINPFLKEKKLKVPAFQVLVHLMMQANRPEELSALLKTYKISLSILFEELRTYAARNYDQSFFKSLIVKNLLSKGEDPVRRAVDSLWLMLLTGTVVSDALIILESNESRFALFTESNKLLAGIYLATKNFDSLKKWVQSADDKQAARGLRGLRLAHKSGISATSFLNETGLETQLIARALKLKIPAINEVSD